MWEKICILWSVYFTWQTLLALTSIISQGSKHFITIGLHRELNDDQMAHVLSPQLHKLSVLIETHLASKLFAHGNRKEVIVTAVSLPSSVLFFLGSKKFGRKKNEMSSFRCWT